MNTPSKFWMSSSGNKLGKLWMIIKVIWMMPKGDCFLGLGKTKLFSSRLLMLSMIGIFREWRKTLKKKTHFLFSRSKITLRKKISFILDWILIYYAIFFVHTLLNTSRVKYLFNDNFVTRPRYQDERSLKCLIETKE